MVIVQGRLDWYSWYTIYMMDYSLEFSPDTFRFLQRQAAVLNVSPQSVVESAVRLLYGNTAHIEQRQTAHGVEAYVRGTRVAVRHVVAFLKAGHTIDHIINNGLPDLPAAAIYEAIAYYHDHPEEIEAELKTESLEAGHRQLENLLTPEQIAQLTGQSA